MSALEDHPIDSIGKKRIFAIVPKCESLEVLINTQESDTKSNVYVVTKPKGHLCRPSIV